MFMVQVKGCSMVNSRFRPIAPKKVDETEVAVVGELVEVLASSSDSGL